MFSLLFFFSYPTSDAPSFRNKRRLTAVWRLGPRLLLCRLGGCCSIIFKTRRDKKDVHGSIRLKREDESGDIDLWPPAAFLPHLSCCPCAQRHGFPARRLLLPLLCSRPHVPMSWWHTDIPPHPPPPSSSPTPSTVHHHHRELQDDKDDT